MGTCFSLSKTEYSPPTAKVISTNGELHEYPVPATICRVLRSEANPPRGYFICNSDALYYDKHVVALAPGEELVGNQIYFVLPLSKLRRRLTAPEMAALAVKASLALQKAEERGVGCGGRRRRGEASMRISPVVEVYGEGGYDDSNRMNSSYSRGAVNDGRGRNGSSDSGNESNVTRSSKRMTRVASSKRAKFAVRSFRMRLSTIYEGTVS